jgi:DNA repair exonuclease SbcCD ATPase subunit
MSVPAQPGLEAVPAIATVTTNNTTTERTYTQAEYEAALAKARKDEKDKLYPTLDGYKDQLSEVQKSLNEIQKEREEAANALAKAQKEAADAAKAKQEAEMDAKSLIETKLKETNDSWESRFTQLYNERESERAQAAKEREYNELIDYRNGRLAELTAEIAPQFHGFITGNTREEIDNAIAQATSATQSIFNEVQQAQAIAPQTPRGVSATGYSAFGPLEGVLGQQTLTADDINKMTMREYEEFRQKNGMAGRDASRNRGLFG